MTPAEHYAEAERLIGEAERMANDAADLIAQDARGAAQGKLDAFDNIMAMASTHALLANTPTTLDEAVEFTAQAVDFATPAPGSRVVMLLASNRRGFPIMGSDAFGTVLVYVGIVRYDGAVDTVRVKWDDLSEPTDHPVSELRVVLGV